MNIISTTVMLKNSHWFANNILRSILKPFPKQDLVFQCLLYESFENTVGKGEIDRNECFQSY